MQDSTIRSGVGVDQTYTYADYLAPRKETSTNYSNVDALTVSFADGLVEENETEKPSNKVSTHERTSDIAQDALESVSKSSEGEKEESSLEREFRKWEKSLDKSDGIISTLLVKELSRISEENKSLKKEYSDFKKEVRILFGRHHNEIQEQKKSNEERDKRIKLLEHKIKRKKNKINHLKKEAENSEKVLERKAAEIIKLTQENKVLQQEKEALQQEKSILQRENEDLDRQLKLEKESSKFKDAQILDKNKTLELKEGQIESLTSQLGNLESSSKKAMAFVATMKKFFGELIPSDEDNLTPETIMANIRKEVGLSEGENLDVLFKRLGLIDSMKKELRLDSESSPEEFSTRIQGIVRGVKEIGLLAEENAPTADSKIENIMKMIAQQQSSLLWRARCQWFAEAGATIAAIIGSAAAVIKLLRNKKPNLVMQFLNP